MHECFLAPALCPVGVFSKTVCGVKSHRVMDKKMLICNLPPFLTPHMRTQEDSGENRSSISLPYPEGRLI